MRIFSHRTLLNPSSDPGLPPSADSQNSAAPTGAADATISAPENPPIKNDETATVGNSDKGGLGEAVRKATAAIADGDKAVFKKARGRYRKCRACDGQPGNSDCEQCHGTGKLPNKNDQPGAENPADVETEISKATDLPPAGPAVVENNSKGGNRFRRSVSSSVKSIFSILGAIVAGYADAAEIDPEFTDKALEKAMPDEKAIADFNDDLDAVLEKHNIQPKNSEEYALAINGLKMAAPLAVLVFEFRRELRRKRKEGK